MTLCTGVLAPWVEKPSERQVDMILTQTSVHGSAPGLELELHSKLPAAITGKNSLQ